MPHNPHGGSFSVADGVARILFIALAALVPFALIPLPYSAVPQGKVLLLAGLFTTALLIWSYARLAEGAVHVPRSVLFYISALLPIAYLASTAVAGWSSLSLVGAGIEQDTLAAVVFMTGIFLLAGFLFYNSATGVRMLLQGFSLGLIVLFALELLYVFFPAWFSLGTLAGETANAFGSWHDLGILAGLALYAALALFFSDYWKGAARAIPVVLGILALATLIIVHFRDIFWAAGALFALTGLVAIRAQMTSGHDLPTALKKAAVWIVVGAALIGAGFFGPTVWEKLPSQISIVQTEVRPSWQGTFDIARQSLLSPTDLIFGTGPNSFIREWGQHKPAGVNQTPFWNSDFNVGVGIIPTSIFTSGAVGLIAWAALILVLLGSMVQFVLDRRALTPQRALFGLTLISVSYLVVYHMIYTPGTALTAITFLALGVLAALAASEGVRTVRIGVTGAMDGVRLVVVVVLILAAIASAGLLAREVLSNILINRSAYIYQTTNDVAASSRALGAAFAVSPNNDRAHRAAAELGIVRLSQLLEGADPNNLQVTDQLQTTLQETIRHGMNAVSIDSSNYQNWLLLAQVYGNLAGVNIDGAYEQARSAYESAATANPTNPLPKFRLAQLMLIKNDSAGARDALNAALALKPDFAAAHFLLSQIEAAAGNGDKAVQAALAAAQLVPEDPLGWFNLGYILFAGGMYQDAAVALQQAITLSPDYSNALFYLGLTANALGQKEGAAQIFDRIAQLNADMAWLPQVSANLRAGKQPFEGIPEFAQQ